MVFYIGVTKAPGIKHYIAVDARETADVVARKVAQNARGRVWIEGRQSASGRLRTPLSAEIVEAFEITPNERARLDAARFRGTDKDGWLAFARLVHDQVLASFAAGVMDFRRMMEVMRSCSLCCRISDREKLMALTAERALLIEPAHRKSSPNPTWVMNSAAALVAMLHEDKPDQPVAPNELNGWTTPILEEAIAWLVTLGLCEPINPRTLYKWYLAQKKTAPRP